MLLCRSGVRSIAAARRATELGIEAYNILEGFEGDADENGHRGNAGRLALARPALAPELNFQLTLDKQGLSWQST